MEYFKPFFVKIAGRARDDDHTSAHEQNMGNSPAATKLAKRAMSEGRIAVLFSASNGIEWMDIYAPEAVRDKILKLADEINGVEI